MGLTIHYEFHAPAVRDRRGAREVVAGLHQAAKSLHFAQCSKLLDWDHEHDDPGFGSLRHFLICYDKTPGAERFLDAAPLDFTMFVIGQPGSESASFGLGRFEETACDIRDASIRRPTGLGGYHWSAFCKTQYASLSNHGGWDNFFKIHDGICRLIDRVISLGVQAVVRDDGHYWEKRDAGALRAETDHWNKLIAAFTGRFKDAYGDRGEGKVIAPITESPEFEQLEAKGQPLLRRRPEIRRLENPDAPP